MPDGACNNTCNKPVERNEDDKPNTENPYKNLFIFGDLNKLFVESGEKLEDDIEEWNRNKNEELLRQDRYCDDDDDYYNEDDYGDEEGGGGGGGYGEEEYGEEEEME